MLNTRSVLVVTAVVLALLGAVVFVANLIVAGSQTGCGTWLGCLRRAWGGDPHYRSIVFLAVALEIAAVGVTAGIPGLWRTRRSPVTRPSPPGPPPT